MLHEALSGPRRRAGGSKSRHIRPMRSLVLLVLVTLAGACGPAGRPPPSVAEGPKVVRVADGRELGFDELVDELVRARAIYVGEHHDSPADHRAELAIVQAIYERDPALVIGLEMFDVRAQQALDDYVRGAIDEAELLERSAYSERWGFDYALLRPLMEWARAHRVRILALNVPREVTRAIARGGLEALSAEQRASIPAELVLEHAAHRAMVLEALAGHPGMTDEQRERFYAAQVVWDESMGSEVARALAAEAGPRRIVVFAGAFHVARGLGIPRTAARRGARPFRVVLPMAAEEASELLAAPPDERGEGFLLVHPEAERDGSPALP